MNAIQQVIARHGRPVIICSQGDQEIKSHAYRILEVPDIVDCLHGILTVIPLQLLSFHLAVLRGYDVSYLNSVALNHYYVSGCQRQWSKQFVKKVPCP